MAKALRIVVIGLAAFLALSYLIARLMPVRTASDVWVLFGGLAAIGVLAAAAYLWFESRKARSEKAETNPTSEASSGDELAQILREAEEKLAASKLGQSARFNHLPVVFLVGSQGATKTTAMVNSGLDPELLAGQVYQDNAIAPTRFANLWYTRQTVFVEPGEPIFSDPGKWSRLIRRMQPGKLAAVRSGEQAPRAVVVCFNSETFLKAGATDAVSGAARALHGKLTEISRLLGISLPVYVLFTKADRFSFFHDYVHTFTKDEASQVLGATLPLATGRSKGVYAEEQAARLTDAFNRLYLSLCEKRMDFLARENDPERLPGIYEFPREMRKGRTAMVQFLVDLCRPSELSAAPFLRGFYFCGVRPIFVRESLAASARRPTAEAGLVGVSGATGIFRLGPGGAQPQPAPAAEITEARKVPQWVFLNHFFSSVLLADHSALTASGTSTKTNSLRRILLASAAVLALLFLIACTISFTHNKQLLDGARHAAAGISSTEAVGANLPSAEALQRLDTLRQSVARLARYNRDGAPLSFRFGLYEGDAMYPEVRKLYFNKFNQLLFGSTQQGLLGNLRGLPATPGPSDPYEYPYDSLKSYLITTSHHDKSTVMYLSPLLLARWSAGRNVDPERMTLAKKQFDFYSEELKYFNPFSSENDSAAIEHARKYLAQFAGAERVYRAILADANSKNPSINFNQKFPGSAQVVINNREMTGAFTKGGWATVQDALKHLDRYLRGEQWVLGEQAVSVGDLAKIEQDLRTRYTNDYISQWRDYLRKSTVVGYSSISNAAQKLKLTSKSDSPLLAMFCLASANTGVDSPLVVKAFKPLHAVIPPACENQYVGSTNQQYMNALAGLQVSLEQIGTGAPDPGDPNLGQAATNATNAKLVTRQMAQTFGVDPEAHLETTVQKLLEDPITSVEPLVKGIGAAALNGKARTDLCRPLSALMSKYPFNPRGLDASMDEVNNILKPGDGLLWKFYEANLQKLLQKQGSQYVAVPAGGVNLTPAFVMFFNRAASFSNQLYASGPNPKVTYTLKPAASEGTQDAQVTIDGQALSFKAPASKQFTWPGPQQGVTGTAKFGTTDIPWANYQGLWGVFKFFYSAQRHPGSGLYEWPVQIAVGGQQPTKVGTLRLEVDPPTFPPAFPNLGCPADAAK